MKCPKCGYERATYNVSRKKYQKKAGQSTHWKAKANIARSDFNATCPKCKFKWNTQRGEE